MKSGSNLFKAYSKRFQALVLSFSLYYTPTTFRHSTSRKKNMVYFCFLIKKKSKYDLPIIRVRFFFEVQEKKISWYGQTRLLGLHTLN